MVEQEMPELEYTLQEKSKSPEYREESNIHPDNYYWSLPEPREE